MKIKILAITALMLFVVLTSTYFFIQSPAGFDLAQRIKYPDYYSWKADKGPFPEKHIWIGLITDRSREKIFIGKTAKEIQTKVPILVPSERRADSHYMQLRESLWTLQFDDSGHCVRFFLDKA